MRRAGGGGGGGAVAGRRRHHGDRVDRPSVSLTNEGFSTKKKEPGWIDVPVLWLVNLR